MNQDDWMGCINIGRHERLFTFTRQGCSCTRSAGKKMSVNCGMHYKKTGGANITQFIRGNMCLRLCTGPISPNRFGSNLCLVLSGPVQIWDWFSRSVKNEGSVRKRPDRRTVLTRPLTSLAPSQKLPPVSIIFQHLAVCLSLQRTRTFIDELM